MAMTRAEHIQWCKDRAIQEYDYYPTEDEKTRNGLTSMMSDLRKHPETGGDGLISLVMMEMMRGPMTRQRFVTFINGFN